MINKRKLTNEEENPRMDVDRNFDSTQNDEADRQFRLQRMKKWRLIVRNLPFSATADDVRSNFSAFGGIEEAVVPKSKKYPDSNAGFGFVQFRKLEDATEAMKGMNEKEINGRQVAVDWAVPKDQYMTAMLEEKESERNRNNSQSTSAPRHQYLIKEEESQRETVASTSDSSSSENEDSDDEETVPSPPDRSSNKKRKFIEKDDDVVDEQNRKSTNDPAAPDEGVEEGRTIFVRNIPFDVTDEDLKKVFAEFGQLKYGVICKYPGTGHSKGSGFVQFIEKAAADECLGKGFTQVDGGISIGGQQLILCKAVSKESARQMEKSKHDHQPKDKRNLHLLRVGLIRAGTLDAVGVSQTDLTKRMRIESANREKIKNFNIFVSPTRICIHNIPSRVDDRELKSICLKAVDEKNAWIKECRIMRDLNRPNLNGVGKSRGFGFVEFGQHEHALKCLKNLNNNVDVFMEDKRPIVEFSLENRKALLAKEQRAEKAKMRAAEMKTQQSSVKGNVSSVPAEKTDKRKTAKGKKTRKFAAPTVPSESGIKIEAGKKMKAFPSHFGPKIRHRKREAPIELKQAKGASKKKQSRTMKRKATKDPEEDSHVESQIRERVKRKKNASRLGKEDGGGKSKKRDRWFQK